MHPLRCRSRAMAEDDTPTRRIGVASVLIRARSFCLSALIEGRTNNRSDANDDYNKKHLAKQKEKKGTGMIESLRPLSTTGFDAVVQLGGQRKVGQTPNSAMERALEASLRGLF